MGNGARINENHLAVKKEKKQKEYQKRKREKRCVYCNKPLTNSDRGLNCNDCAVRLRLTIFEGRIRKIEKFLDLILKEKNI